MLLALDLTQLNNRCRCRASTDNALENCIPLPPLPEQQRIAAILERADRLRRLRRYALELSEGYLQAVFVEMFGDPVRNPKGWKEGQLARLCAKTIDCPHATPTYSSDPTPYACVRSSDIQNGYLDWGTTKYVSESEYRGRVERLVPASQRRSLLPRRSSLWQCSHHPKGYQGLSWAANDAVSCVAWNCNGRVRMGDPGERSYLHTGSAFGWWLRFAPCQCARHQSIHRDDSAFRVAASICPCCPEAHPSPHPRARGPRQAEQLFGALLDQAFRGEFVDLSGFRKPDRSRVASLSPRNRRYSCLNPKSSGSMPRRSPPRPKYRRPSRREVETQANTLVESVLKPRHVKEPSQTRSSTTSSTSPPSGIAATSTSAHVTHVPAPMRSRRFSMTSSPAWSTSAMDCSIWHICVIPASGSSSSPICHWTHA